MFKSTITMVSHELSKKERIYIKDTSDAVSLNDAVGAEGIIIAPKVWAVIDIENDNSDDGHYTNYVVIDTYDGIKYVTGSDSFWRAFEDIADEMEGEPFEVKVFKRPSKNFSGSFLTCSIVSD